MHNKTAKITCSLEADQALNKMLKITNNDYTGGQVTKNNLTSWIILHFESNFTPKAIERLRKEHFDQVAYLDSVVKQLKRARKSGSSVPKIKTILSALENGTAPLVGKPIESNSLEIVEAEINK